MTGPDHPARGDIRRVIEGGFCIGCGACSALDARFGMGVDAVGMNRVVAYPDEPAALAAASAVCPFAEAPDEDRVAARLFPDADYDDGLGAHRGLYAGWSLERRASGGSGGLTRWLLAKALSTGAVDFVLAVDRKTAGDGAEAPLFAYAIHDDAGDYIAHASTSAYHPVSFDAVLRAVRDRPGRFAVTALPCFARALRAMAERDEALAGRIALVSGVICGGLKSRRYAEYLGWQMGVVPARLDRIDFRGKGLSRRANEKTVDVWAHGDAGPGPAASRRVQDLQGTDYGVGYFKPKACDYCDDVFAETADVAFGDAWIAPYDQSPEGTNVVVARSRLADDLLRRGAADGEIVLHPLTPDQVRRTQESGLRHRRQGLAARLWLSRRLGRWTPAKRVGPAAGPPAFMLTQAIRTAVRRISSSPLVSVEGRTMPLLMRPLLILHRRLRPWSSRHAAPPPRVVPTAPELADASAMRIAAE